MTKRRRWIVFFSTFLLSANVCAQLRQINPAKLPQGQRVQTTYSNVRPIESMAHSWSSTWTYDTPKTQVASLLTSSLRDLRSAEIAAPQNEELLLLTGIVAHLAYNVDVEETYEVAVQSFEKANKLAPADYRPEWFLASHRCQSNELKAGMDQMLAIEIRNRWQQLPVDFWDDYINCSTMSLMPAHTLRAIDHVVHLGEDPSSYGSAVDIAHNRYKSTDANTTYPAHDAWQATQGAGDVQFTSQLCGMGFSAHKDWHMDIKDVAKGTCISMIETGPYPSKSGQGTPTILVLSRTAKPQERFDDFVQSFLKKYPSARPITAPSCPSDKCVAFEIVTNTMYQSEGGGHLLAVGFAEQPPDFPGLLFERPDAPPKDDSGEKVTYYRPTEKLHRLPGILYTVVELDSNASIFEKAAADFQYLLKSIQLD
ncbi:MAG: hypothetical protein ACHQT6_11880 [Candidatus Acidiferrales bacterium]